MTLSFRHQRDLRAGPFEIFHMGDLSIGDLAPHHGHGFTETFNHHRVVGDAGIGSETIMSRPQHCGPECLRGLHCDQRITIRGSEHACPCVIPDHLLDRVGHCDPRYRSGHIRVIESSHHPPVEILIGEGSSSVMHTDHLSIAWDHSNSSAHTVGSGGTTRHNLERRHSLRILWHLSEIHNRQHHHDTRRHRSGHRHRSIDHPLVLGQVSELFGGAEPLT